MSVMWTCCRHPTCQERLDTLVAEVATLRAENEDLNSTAAKLLRDYDQQTQEALTAKAEVERLRAERDAETRAAVAEEIRSAVPFASQSDVYGHGIRTGMRAAADLIARGSAGTPEVVLPADWWDRKGHYDEGGEFTYCDAHGPEQAHCVRTRRNHTGLHQWAWFTREQRARAEAADPEAGT